MAAQPDPSMRASCQAGWKCQVGSIEPAGRGELLLICTEAQGANILLHHSNRERREVEEISSRSWWKGGPEGASVMSSICKG